MQPVLLFCLSFLFLINHLSFALGGYAVSTTDSVCAAHTASCLTCTTLTSPSTSGTAAPDLSSTEDIGSIAPGYGGSSDSSSYPVNRTTSTIKRTTTSQIVVTNNATGPVLSTASVNGSTYKTQDSCTIELSAVASNSGYAPLTPAYSSSMISESSSAVIATPSPVATSRTVSNYTVISSHLSSITSSTSVSPFLASQNAANAKTIAIVLGTLGLAFGFFCSL